MDPDIENGQESMSPYAFGFDNAVRYNDPDGRNPGGNPSNPFSALNGSGNAALSPDLLTSITTPFKNFVVAALALTDVNDATVIATMITRGSDAINIDGTKASGWDKGFAIAGAVLPIVSGAVVGKVGKAVGGEIASLLPGEGAVERYADLVAAGSKGDNITPHHMPSAKHMEQHGVGKADGIAMNMEHPHPGNGGRHRSTATYGNTSDATMSPRNALAAGLKDARKIYQAQGLYDKGMKNALLDVISQNKSTHPQIFIK